ncbi:hypothetical protein ACFVFJ_45760, partial [Streptomyces sp. NPDC057717]|uniref:hypothetical protein n=1 Tax=Streptomyces sp. NPDC057717 TaxID=3346224 RepID=UPI00367ACAD3
VAGVNENSGNGIYGRGHNGLYGDGKDGNGVVGISANNDGVLGVGNIAAKAGVAGVNDHGGNGLYGRGGNGLYAMSNVAGGNAGVFDGNVLVRGDLKLTGGDVAEQFDVAARAEGAPEVDPGTVVVVDGQDALAPCVQAYDTCVAGVVSGAGDRVPALVLDRKEDDEGAWRRAIAVVGKVWCRADAASRPIRVGDLLTTSSTPGHAMAAVDRDAAFGSVLGKAMTPLASGTGLVLVLVGLG